MQGTYVPDHRHQQQRSVLTRGVRSYPTCGDDAERLNPEPDQLGTDAIRDRMQRGGKRVTCAAGWCRPWPSSRRPCSHDEA